MRASMIRNFFRIVAAIFVYAAILHEVLSHALTTDLYREVIWVILVGQTIRLILEARKDTLTIISGIVFFTLYFFPSIGLVIFDDLYPIHSISAFIVSSDLLKMFDRKRPPRSDLSNRSLGSRTLYFFIFLQIWMLISPFFVSGGSLITLVAPLSISVVVLEIMLKNGGQGRLVLFAIASYAVMFFFHLTLHWSGYGRLIVGAYMILVLLVILRYYDIKFRLWVVPIVLPLALYFAQASRYGRVEDFRTLLVGSAGHHMMVTEDARRRADQGYFQGLGEFWEQFQLFFLGWFPRAFWPEKPLGAGLTSVDVIYGRAGVSQRYSQSLGFLGEQYYLLGEYAFIGLSVMLIIIIAIRILIKRFSGDFIAPIAAFDVSLISFFWGSMSTFGNRVWFIVIPGLAFLIIRNMNFKFR